MEGLRWIFLGYELLLSLSVLLKGDKTAAEKSDLCNCSFRSNSHVQFVLQVFLPELFSLFNWESLLVETGEPGRWIEKKARNVAGDPRFHVKGEVGVKWDKPTIFFVLRYRKPAVKLMANRKVLLITGYVLEWGLHYPLQQNLGIARAPQISTLEGHWPLLWGFMKVLFMKVMRVYESLDVQLNEFLGSLFFSAVKWG